MRMKQRRQTRSMTMRLPQNLYEALCQLASLNDCTTVSEYVRCILAEHTRLNEDALGQNRSLPSLTQAKQRGITLHLGIHSTTLQIQKPRKAAHYDDSPSQHYQSIIAVYWLQTRPTPRIPLCYKTKPQSHEKDFLVKKMNLVLPYSKDVKKAQYEK